MITVANLEKLFRERFGIRVEINRDLGNYLFIEDSVLEEGSVTLLKKALGPMVRVTVFEEM